MKMVEKILARASGMAAVEPGQIVVAEVDGLVMHDLSAYLTSKVYERQVGLPVRHPERVTLVFDHTFCPATEETANVLVHNRAWAQKHGFNLYDCGSGNIHHVVAREGYARPGSVIVGSDSHTPVYGALGAFATGIGNDSHAGTVLPYGKAWFRVPETVNLTITGHLLPGTTPRDVALWLVGEIGEGGAVYKALQFDGEFITGLPFWERWLLPLITIDVGAKCGLIEPDEVTDRFIATLPQRPAHEPLLGDAGDVSERWEYDVSGLAPQVACPPTVGNVHPVDEVAGREISWAELGGHGGGRIEDIRLAADVLRRVPKHPDVRFNIVPSSRQVLAQALDEGLVAELHAAGVTFFPPSTGSNQAVNMGAMSAGEAMISTHARNFPGRNGSSKAEMYLASALTVAASATQGQIADPREVISDPAALAGATAGGGR
jgi:3-isopropylmalate/(R)-2-methylmalate dehydratase large subunit